MTPPARNDPLAPIEEKILAGERLSRDEGLALMRSSELLRLGRLADLARRRAAAAAGAGSPALTGDEVYFINNRHINHTNVCKNRCRFCAFSKDEEDEGAYTLTREEVLAKGREAVELGASELHIVGGESPDLPYTEVREMIVALKAQAPEVVLTAFTASEIVHFAGQTGTSEEEVLLDLKAAGLGSLPGGGAEVFAPRVRDLVCPKKISGERWLEVHQLAHRLGLPTNATMLYGHVETDEERVDHLLALRAAQDETGGFQAFIPLAFHPRNTELSHLSPSTGFEDLKVLATARLLLDNFPHIKAYWVMIGLKLAQLSLYFGVDDVDGTIVEETITQAAGSEAGQAVSRAELVRLIQDAGRVPVERDTFYNSVRRYESKPAGESEAPSPKPAAPGAPVRVGHIEFMNCYPLYFGLEGRARDGSGGSIGFELVAGVPTDLNRMLLAGTIDFGPISSIEYARSHRQLLLSRRLSISAKGAVDSIQLVSPGPLEEISRVALTPKSATSVALLKTILKLRYSRELQYRELREPAAAALEQGDAVLLIGDEGLEAMYFPFPGAVALDLGKLWQEWTGLPMVYAVWAARREFASRRKGDLLAVEDELVSSNDYSREHIIEVVQSATGLSRFDRRCLSRYFSMLYYGFGPEYEAGLRRFYELAFEAGELPEVPDLRFLDEGM